MTRTARLQREKNSFMVNKVPKWLLLCGASMVIIYTIFITFFIEPGNTYLFGILIVAQLFFTFQSLTFLFTIWETSYRAKRSRKFTPGVDVLITVCGEPVSVVEETLKAAVAMSYPKFKIFILNDGFVAKKSNWREIEELAKRYKVNCITRKIPGGAKAGNINNALRKTRNPFVAVFDADHVPHSDFLSKTMGYFVDGRMGFVQTPQFYNNNDSNLVTQSSWDQQALFFGAICTGKNRLNSTFMCGTNMVIRRKTLIEAGGMCETNIAEDFLTSLFIHSNGWKSLYIHEVLAEGLAPEDFLSYYKQQFRWARGSLEVIFKYNPLIMKGLSWKQKLQYLSSASYYLSGFIVLMNIALPLIFFFTGLVPLNISSMKLTMVFLPYIFLNLYILQLGSNSTFTFKALAFSISSFFLQIRAVIAVLLKAKTTFSVTSKTQITGNFLHLVVPHLIYLVLVGVGIAVAYHREGLSAALFNNIAWSAIYVIIFTPFIYAAAPAVRIKPLKLFRSLKLHEEGQVIYKKSI